MVPFISPEVYIENLSTPTSVSDYLIDIMIDQLGFDSIVQPEIECEQKLNYADMFQ